MSLISSAPYNDDFDSTKNFYQLLFNPNRAVGARELTTMQSILKNQMGTHAKHIFKEGTAVIGGQLTVKRVVYVVVEDAYNSFPVVVEEFLDKEIIEQTSQGVASGYEGTVLKVKTEAGKKILFVDAKNVFAVGSTIKVKDENIFATVKESGFSNFLGVDNGVFFLNSNFVEVQKQSIILEDFNSQPTGSAGIVWSEEIVTSAQDPSLLDNARGTANYGAEGADRLKINTSLIYVKEGDTKPSNFALLYEIRDGNTKSQASTTVYSDLAKELARRTYDESGNYTVNPFTLILGDGIKNKITQVLTSGVIRTTLAHELIVGDEIILSGIPSVNGSAIVAEVVDANQFRVNKTFTANYSDPGMVYTIEEDFSIEVGKGKAYVRGFEIEKIAGTEVAVARARQKQLVENYNVVPAFGNYILVANLNGSLNTSNVVSINAYNAPDQGGSAIGTLRVMFMRYDSGDVATGTAKYRLYILSSSFNTGYALENIRSVGSSGFKANIDGSTIISGKTQIFSSASSSLIYEIPQQGVATLSPGGVSSTSFTSHQYFTAAATGSNAVFSLGSGNASTFYGPIGSNFVGTDIEKSLYVFTNQATGAPLAVSNIQISNGGKQLNVTFASAPGTVNALMPVQNGLAIPRTKTRASKNVNVAPGVINSQNPNYSLNTVDVIRINSITVNGVDVKDRFILDNGQRDSIYESGSIRLRNGLTIPQDASVLVNIDYYIHSGQGYFSVDSYPDDYADIPTYTSASSNKTYSLSDVLDFRPSPNNGAIPIPNVPISADYEFYLPRRDAVVLYWNGTFDVIEGRAEINPQYPKIPEDAMVLYYLDVPAYTRTGHDCQTRYVDNKRYTMRDIGRLEKRIDRLEYYTALSLLEFDTKNKTVYDENGFERFKNGFLVDSFTGHGVGNVDNADYKCAIDSSMNVLRPSFDSSNVPLQISNSSGVQSNTNSKDRIGEIITLPYTEETLIWNNIASRYESVTPFLLTDIVGVLSCNPPADDWVDTTKSPAVMVNLEGDLDAWEAVYSAIEGMAPGFGTQWDAWQTTWSGSTTNTSVSNNGSSITSTTTTTTTSNQVRTGTQTTLGTERIEASTGEYVTDVNLSYYMRAINIACEANAVRPSRDFHIFIDEENVNNLVVPATGYAPFSEGAVRSDENGNVKFTLNIPNGRFRTGERFITIIDDSQNLKDQASSYASYVFTASGLQTTVRESVISTRTPAIDTRKITDNRTVVSTASRSTSVAIFTPSNQWSRGGGSDQGSHGGAQNDPLAQTFYVSSEAYPNGVFVTSSTVYLRNKPATGLPLQLQLRTVTNGYPDASNIIPFSHVYVKPEDIRIPVNTADLASILSAGTTVNFDAPVYLEPGKEYAFVMLSHSLEYETYLSAMGQPILGTDQLIMSQVSLGSLFKSQNSSTWTAFQNEDLMFKLNKAVFTMNTPGTVEFKAKHSVDTYISEFTHNFEPINFSNVTSIDAEYSLKDSSTLVQGALTKYYLKNKEVPVNEKLIAGDSDFVSKLTISTRNKDVSPFLDLARNSLITVHNQINDLGLLKSGFVITNPGSGYATAPTITVSGGGGFGAVLEAVVNNGFLVDVKVINEGSGYTSVPTFGITGADGTGAAITYQGFETDPSGGNALARYITKNIMLAEGFETDYISVTFDVNKRFGTDVKVYYRAKSPDDSNIIESKRWVPMVKSTANEVISGNDTQFTEVTFVPSTNTIEYVDNGYTFTKANVIAIKIVMTSGNSSVVPKIKNFRAVTTAP